MKIISRSFTFSMLFFLAFDTNSPLLGGMVTTFTGGDVGEGLDLTGAFPYAINIGGSANSIQGVNFTPDSATPGLDLGAPPGDGNAGIVYGGTNPTYGGGTPTANDDGLRGLMEPGRYKNPPAQITINLSGLTLGAQYQLQLLFQSPRPVGQVINIDLSVEGLSIADDLNIGALSFQGGGTGVLVTETFTASDSVLNILVSPGNMSLGENTPFINALTLESVPEPGSALLLACGLALVLGRRQRANEGTLRPLIMFKK